MKKRSYFILFLIVGLVAAYLVYNYMYQDHRDIANEKASYVLTAAQIVNEFSEDSNNATSKFLDKTVQITGIVTEVETDNFLIGSDILCYTDSLTIASLQKKKEFTVKGRFIGYDELLENIKLDQVSIVK